MTNLNKTKEEIIYELLISLNNGNNGYSNHRLMYAIEQYDQLVNAGIIKEFPLEDSKTEKDIEKTDKLQGLYFGAVLKYCPPDDIDKTCIYLKDDCCGDAVVVFKEDNYVSYVEHEYLRWN